MKLENEKLI